MSDYGVCSVSKVYQSEPFLMNINGQSVQLQYTPAESDLGMFGGNSNWREPIWMPVNYLLIESLLKFHAYYGDDFRVECPVSLGEFLSLREVALMFLSRLSQLFMPNTEGVDSQQEAPNQGRRPIHSLNLEYKTDANFKDLVLFYEYFDGDTGRGVGASHQTGWTGLIAELLFN